MGVLHKEIQRKQNLGIVLQNAVHYSMIAPRKVVILWQQEAQM